MKPPLLTDFISFVDQNMVCDDPSDEVLVCEKRDELLMEIARIINPDNYFNVYEAIHTITSLDEEIEIGDNSITLHRKQTH